MPVLDTRGARIAYTDTGPREAPTVLFGHGLLFGGWMFRPQIDVLRERYRCVAIDWRGQGESPPAAGGYDMDTLAGDAVALIRALDVAPVHWVGLSMGGFIGQRVTARHGDLVRSLTLLDTSCGPENPAKVREYKRLALFQRVFGIKPVLGKVEPLLFGPRPPAGVVAEWRRRIVRADRAALRSAVLGVADREPVEHEIGRVSVPTLVVVGTDDKATPPPESERIVARIPGARLHVVPDCGHTSTLEQPAAITGLLTEFLG